MSSTLASVVSLHELQELQERFRALKRAIAAAKDPLNMSGGDTLFLEDELRMVRRELKNARRAERARERAEREQLLQREQDRELRALFRTCTAIPEGWNCAICWEDNQESVVSTQCEHNFHEGCILTWVRGKQTCPLCRGSLVERSEVENG